MTGDAAGEESLGALALDLTRGVGAAVRFHETLVLRGVEAATRWAEEQQGTDR